MDVFDAAERYKQEGRQLIVLAGKDYGSGSSRDWAAKGPWMLVRPFSAYHCVNCHCLYTSRVSSYNIDVLILVMAN